MRDVRIHEEKGALVVRPEAVASPRGRVLLLHGYGRSRHEMLPLAMRLAWAGWEVVSPDLPGHGESAESLSAGSVESAMQAWRRGFAPDILVGHSLGARIALSMGGCARVAVLSPPIESRFDESTRAELLAHLRPRWVRETKPMAALAELLQSLPVDAPGIESGLALVAHKELSSVEAGLALWSGEPWSFARIRDTDHGSILVSSTTCERILAWMKA